ncbi:nuclear transport factor 2 family protein [Spongiimicrobium sp. 3-5]|uniref:nuclear transport factor 2 family protein n=1 Tax=Spongiimicrobium sp. 3-5 TaxID=3332596 RepID=UPI00398124DA
MKKIYILLFAFNSILGLKLSAQTEIEQINKTLQNYIMGTANGEPELVKNAFQSDFNLYLISGDTLRIIDGKGYLTRVKKGKKYNRIGKVISIDTENDAATAKIEVYFPERNMVATDYLLLLKIKEEWRIMHKIINLKTHRQNQNKNLDKQNEFNLINKTLLNYIEGTSNGEPNRLNKAFHKGFNLYYIKNDTLSIIDGEKYISNFKLGKKNNRIGKVLSVDYEGDAAIAKIEVLMPDRDRIAIDYMLLLKIKGEWKIIHKSFTSKRYS